jgi:hypothetical protein
MEGAQKSDASAHGFPKESDRIVLNYLFRDTGVRLGAWGCLGAPTAGGLREARRARRRWVAIPWLGHLYTPLSSSQDKSKKSDILCEGRLRRDITQGPTHFSRAAAPRDHFINRDESAPPGDTYRLPWSLAIISTRSFCHTPTHEYVVPRSIPWKETRKPPESSGER